MEEKINIAEILKDKPQGTKLYADAFGELSIVDIYTKDEIGINLLNRHRDELLFYSDGRYCTCGEPILFPSKEMRDWSKFAWKKGDVLVSNNGKREVLFKTWENDSYTKFVGFHCLITNDYEEVEYDNGTTVFNTNDFKGTEAEDAAQTYINTIEECLGGKLNLETLEIEKHQTEFKDGDILYITDRIESCNYISIYKNQEGRYIYRYATMLEDNFVIMTEGGVLSDNGGLSKRYATEEEKQQLFDALAKVGKAWDDEKKQIVDLKPKWTPKPFDRVITRTPDTPWTANFFSHIDSDGIKNCIDDRYLMCLPYNEETAKLIGTTNNVE